MEPQPPPIKVTIDELTAPVRIGDDAAVFPHFKANFILGGHRAEVRFEATADRVVATEVTLTATDTKTGITAEPLSWLARSLPQLIEHAASALLLKLEPNGTGWRAVPGDQAQLEQLLDVTRGRRRVTRGTLKDVAAVWADSNGAIDAVVRHFAVSSRTAYRYVQLAKEAGLITGTEEEQ